MENNNKSVTFFTFASHQTNCCQCGKVIKKNDLCYSVDTLKAIGYEDEYNQYNEEDVVCDECYTGHLIKLMDKLGITVVNENGKFKNFNEVIKEFCDAWDKIIKKEESD